MYYLESVNLFVSSGKKYVTMKPQKKLWSVQFVIILYFKKDKKNKRINLK